MTFKAGESGNPNGRPSGSKNKRSQLAKLLEPFAEELVMKAVELARDGDVNALRLCLERLIPKATSEPIIIDFDTSELDKPEYLMNFGRQILAAMANGDITPADAKMLCAATEVHRRLIENGEMKYKLEAIQQAIKTGR